MFDPRHLLDAHDPMPSGLLGRLGRDAGPPFLFVGPLWLHHAPFRDQRNKGPDAQLAKLFHHPVGSLALGHSRGDRDATCLDIAGRIDSIDSNKNVAVFADNQHAGRHHAGVVEDFDRIPVNQSEHFPGMVGLGRFEGNLSDINGRDMKSSSHAGDYRAPEDSRQRRVATIRSASYDAVSVVR